MVKPNAAKGHFRFTVPALSHEPNLTELVLNKQSCQTRDLGGSATTPEMTRAILNELDGLYA